MKKLGWPTIFCNSLEVADSGEITGFKMRCQQSKLTTVKALQSIGYETIASGDSYNDLGMIQAMGLRAIGTGRWEDLSKYRVIFNTIPAPVLSQRDLESTRPDCLLLELASAPGGIEAGGSRSLIQAPGLPGKTAPETAGRLIGETILRLAGCQERSSHVR